MFDRKKLINKEMIEDLNRYTLIFPRETITYNTLTEIGIDKNKLKLMSDPAFVLREEKVQLPKNFKIGNTVGLNISPIVMQSGKDENIVLNNYYNVIEYILENTDMQIALIPHVYTINSEDSIPNKMIYEKYKHTNRVIIFNEYYNCMQLKFIISKCRFIIAARTHASIAAYSTCVPTLVIGYSVKARGIAKDIFGEEEGYVISAHELENEKQLLEAFLNLFKNENKIRNYLNNIMPMYIKKAWHAGEEIKKLIERKE